MSLTNDLTGIRGPRGPRGAQGAPGKGGFVLPPDGVAGQSLLSDGDDGAVWGAGGGGDTSAAEVARVVGVIDVFSHSALPDAPELSGFVGAADAATGNAVRAVYGSQLVLGAAVFVRAVVVGDDPATDVPERTGIYTVTDAGDGSADMVLTRHEDFATAEALAALRLVSVDASGVADGVSAARGLYQNLTPGAITLETTALLWRQIKEAPDQALPAYGASASIGATGDTIAAGGEEGSFAFEPAVLESGSYLISGLIAFAANADGTMLVIATLQYSDNGTDWNSLTSSYVQATYHINDIAQIQVSPATVGPQEGRTFRILLQNDATSTADIHAVVPSSLIVLAVSS